MFFSYLILYFDLSHCFLSGRLLARGVLANMRCFRLTSILRKPRRIPAQVPPFGPELVLVYTRKSGGTEGNRRGLSEVIWECVVYSLQS